MTRVTAAVLLVLYSCVVANLTLMDPSSGEWAFSRADYWADALSGGRLTWTQTEVLANVALFVPVGFLLVLVLGRLLPAIALGVLGSVFIEAVQGEYLPSRVATVADVAHNGYGVLLGVALAAPFVLWRARPARPVRGAAA